VSSDETERNVPGEVGAKAEALVAETVSAVDVVAVETATKALALAVELAETLEKISGRLEKITKRLGEVSGYGRRSRRIIVALAVSFSLDIVLTVVLAFTAFTAHSTAASNASLVSGLHTANVMSCHNGNSFRAAQTSIWQEFVGLLTKPAPGESAAQIAATDKLAAGFLKNVVKVNHPIDCASLYGK
jgi:hypothetical protein